MIGHELSHVRNYDIRFSLIVGVLVGAIALLADFFLRFTFWGGGRGGAATATAADGLQAVDPAPSRSSSRSSRRSSAASSSSPSAASASTSPTRRRSS